jgi:hypothetical protein
LSFLHIPRRVSLFSYRLSFILALYRIKEKEIIGRFGGFFAVSIPVIHGEMLNKFLAEIVKFYREW